MDLITDFNNQLLTREILIQPYTIRFTSGDQLKSNISNRYEFLDEDFNVYKDFVIPSGEYSNWSYYFDVITAKRRRLWATSGFGFGGFFSGKRQENTAELGYQVAVPLFISGTGIRNHVKLPGGEFITYITRFNINILFSPDITLYSFIQYDNKSDNIGWQTRFQLIIQPGRELFFVWNSITHDPLESLRPDELDARLKLKYTIRF